MSAVALPPVWTEPVQQRVFRALLLAVAQPGTACALPVEAGAVPPAVGVLAALVDGGSAIADPHGLLDEALLRLLAASLVPAAAAEFILVDGARGPAGLEPRLGTLAEPELGATLVVAVAGFGPAPGAERRSLRGPGIESCLALEVQGLDPRWFEARSHWLRSPPCGVDLLLAAPGLVVGLPRTTRVER